MSRLLKMKEWYGGVCSGGSVQTSMYELFDVNPWPHQVRGVQQVLDLLPSKQAICLTSPTGGGKTQMMIALVRWANQQRPPWPVALYSNRNLLLEQTGSRLTDHGIDFGMRSAYFSEQLALLRDVQLCSIQTEQSQVLARNNRELHKAKLVIVDEAHLMKVGGSEEIFRRHLADGAKLVGVTATPLSLGHLYDGLVVAGTNSELRECGALVPALMFAPDELDTSKIKRTVTGEYNLADIRRSVWTWAIVGRVIQHYNRYNPDGRPAIGFAPGVPESIGCAKEFYANGIPAAHIDGDEVWVDGEYHKSSREVRHQVIKRWKDGDIRIVWNRFVLREGLDFPWLYHLILATPVGSLMSYIQLVGRVLRKSAETPDTVIVQDHGGSAWRHGSPNTDWDWANWWDLPMRVVTDGRIDRLREKKEREPITCPRCGLVRRSGNSCPPPPFGCGYEHHRKSRMILQRDGTLREVHGDIVRARHRRSPPGVQQLWDALYFPSSKSKSTHASTFLQLEARFFLEHNFYPPRTLANMPEDGSIDWYRKARDVPKDRLCRRSMAEASIG